jgi:hypothetical protein
MTACVFTRRFNLSISIYAGKVMCMNLVSCLSVSLIILISEEPKQSICFLVSIKIKLKFHFFDLSLFCHCFMIL